ncbi:MAG: tetratricopeptide repeat protein [Planctomycetes bacterium]|nr:tetratricopeptide repeat protein [Planctomycetota bacterium]
MPSRVEEEEITPANWKIFVDQSTGVIGRDGYDGVELLRRAGDKKGTFYAAEDIVERIYTTQPEALLDAYDSQARGNLAQAIGEFRAVADSKEVSEVYRLEAYYMTGICYLQMNNRANAMAHFGKWPGQNSQYTPEVFRIMAEIHTEQKAFDKARAPTSRSVRCPTSPSSGS